LVGRLVYNPRHAHRQLSAPLEGAPAGVPCRFPGRADSRRQCGKTTLAQTVGLASGYEYISFDDHAVRRAAETDPGGFVDALPPRVVLDEAQKAPGIFSAVKLAVGRRPSSSATKSPRRWTN